MAEFEIKEMNTSSKTPEEIRQKAKKKRRKKKAASWLRTVILILAVCGIVYSGYNLSTILIGYYQGQQSYKALKSYVVNTTSKDSQLEAAAGKLKDGSYPLLSVDFAGLQSVNKDVVGWIDIPGLELSYPLVQASDNEKYLHTTVSNQSNRSGSIFVDYRTSGDFQGKNTFLHGHNMKDGSMFAKLMKYTKSETYGKAPNVWIYTPTAVYKYTIFSAQVVDASGEAYTFAFNSDQEFGLYLESMVRGSTIAAPVKPTPADKIITLSTCTNVTDEERYIVQAMLVNTYTLEEAATKTTAD